MSPLVILAIGIATVIGLILILRLNAFLALITAAIIVSVLADGDPAKRISRVAEAFGAAAGQIGIVIGLAAIIGECMMRSGAADRIVQFFLRVLGEKRAPIALMLSGFVLGIPVFFDTVFYLLVPLARSLYAKTRKNYLLYLLAIAAGGAITHTLVPPTPGPLVMAEQLQVDIGTMILGGLVVAFPAAIIGLMAASLLDRFTPITLREIEDAPPTDESAGINTPPLPSLFLSILPVALPVLLISSNTVVESLIKQTTDETSLATLEGYRRWTSVFGNPNLALLLSTAVAMFLVWNRERKPLSELAHAVEHAVMSGGAIILITAAGGAFGAMLKVANVGGAIQALFQSDSGQTSGLALMMLGYSIAAMLKIAQGSSTVAMITASGMLGAAVADDATLGFHPVYLATAIGSGSLMISWMNDSGFWIFAKMGGLRESEALRSWTPLLAILSLVGLGVSILGSQVLPMLRM